MTRDQRRHKRYDVDDVHGSLVYHLDAEVLNMSLTGMAIETRTLLKVGTHYALRIPHGDSVLKFTADVKWCHLVRTVQNAAGEVVPIYQAGIDFREILDEKARQVLQFIERHVIVELDKRIFGRFKMQRQSGVNLDASHEFVVRRISLSGMLVETDFTPAVNTIFDLEVRPDGKRFELAGRVAHVRQLAGDGAERSELGIEFLSVSSPNQRALESLIQGLLE